MKRKSKIAFLTILIVFLFTTSVYALFYLADSMTLFLCENKVIEIINSPDNLMKVVTFERNCGATTDFSIQASVLLNDININNDSVGNVLTLDSNDGKAWPRDSSGRAIIRARWDNSTSLIIESSSNAQIYYQQSKIDNVNIKFNEITK